MSDDVVSSNSSRQSPQAQTPGIRSKKRVAITAARRDPFRATTILPRSKSLKVSGAAAQLESIWGDSVGEPIHSRRSLVEEAKFTTRLSPEVGRVYDFAVRLHAKHQDRKVHNQTRRMKTLKSLGDAISLELLEENQNQLPNARAVVQMVEEAASAHEELREDVSRERLQQAIADNIMAFKKRSKASGVCYGRTFVDIAREIAGYRKQVHCLTAELYQSKLSSALKEVRDRKQKAEADAEHHTERAQCLQDFWHDYHQCERLLDESAVEPKASPRHDWDATLEPPESAQDFFNTVKAKARDLSSWQKTMTWKSRAVRDECTHVGWEHAQQWRKFTGGGNQHWHLPAPSPFPLDPSSEDSDESLSCSTTRMPQSGNRRAVAARKLAPSHTRPDSIASTAEPSCGSSCSARSSPRPHSRMSARSGSALGKFSYAPSELRHATRCGLERESSPASPTLPLLAGAAATNNGSDSAAGNNDGPASFLVLYRNEDPTADRAASASPCSYERADKPGTAEVSDQLVDGDLPSISRWSDPSETRWWNQSYDSDWLDTACDSSQALPPMSEAFMEPRARHTRNDSATKLYMRACAKRKCMPIAMPFMTGQCTELSAAGRALTDRDLQSISTKVQSAKQLDAIDFEGNSMLSDKALRDFLKILLKTPATWSLKRFSIQKCSLAGIQTISFIGRLLTNPAGATQLLHLDVSGVQISCSVYLSICIAIGTHQTLHSVNLAETGFGNACAAGVAKQCLSALMKQSKLKSLDISWNRLTSDVFSHFGERLVQAGSISDLSLRGCSGSADSRTGVLPVEYFIEHLAKDKVLTRLDVAMNRIDFNGAMCLEDALDNHHRLSFIDISNNPLGESGIRSFLRLFVRKTSGLTACDIKGCCHGREPGHDEFAFSVSSPFGRYVLDLSNPSHRSMLRMIYKTCERLGLKLDTVIDDAEASYGSYHYPKKTKDGIWPVHKDGTLSLTLNARKMMENSMSEMRDADFSTILRKYNAMMKLKPSFVKALPFLHQWVITMNYPTEQTVLLKAISRDFIIEYPMVEMLLKSSLNQVDAVQQLSLCVVGDTAYFLTQLFVPNLVQFASVQRRLTDFMGFNPCNPTGHYTLQLDDAIDFVIAEKLLLLNHWEGMLALRSGRMDISQTGNCSNFRNERYRGRPFAVENYTEWRLPMVDELELDYASDRRPPLKPEMIDTDTVKHILAVVQASECSVASKIMSLRMMSHDVYVNAMQARELTSIIPDKSARMDLFVMLYTRIVDIQHEKIVRCKFTRDEIRCLCFRLGFCVMFPYYQPENWDIELDCSHHDQRLTLMNLTVLATKENRRNIADYSFTREDGTLDPLVQGCPKTWETFVGVPRCGVFRATYKCAPEARNLQLRRTLLKTYSLFDTPSSLKAQDIKWWMGSDEAPQDVFSFSIFLVSHFPGGIDEAFVFIDGADGNGVLSYSELSDGIAKMGLRKFRSRKGNPADEMARVKAVFRYLDINGDGKITLLEFMALQQMFREVELSVREFASFLERTWGPALKDAWEAIDEDGSGEIDMDEWLAACHKKGFFGDARQVYHFIDQDDEGTISYDEFRELRNFQRDSVGFEKHKSFAFY